MDLWRDVMTAGLFAGLLFVYVCVLSVAITGIAEDQVSALQGYLNPSFHGFGPAPALLHSCDRLCGVLRLSPSLVSLSEISF